MSDVHRVRNVEGVFMLHALLICLSLNSVTNYEDYQDLYFWSLFQFYYPEDMVMASFCTDSSPELAARAQEYAENWSNFETSYDLSACENWVDSMSVQKRAGMERGLVSLISGSDTDSLALIFLSKAPMPYEWEGYWRVIEAETVHAMSFLRRNPGTPLEPYIVLLLMHRLRAQEECMRVLESIPADRVVALYDSLLQVALNDPDPLVGYFARELDAEPFVYIPN